MPDAAQFFTYLRERARLRLQTVRDLASYEEAIFLADLPFGEPEFGCAIGPEGVATHGHKPATADILLRFERPAEPPRPLPPAALVPWLEAPAGRAPADSEPELRERLPLPPASGSAADAPTVFQERSDVPGLEELLSRYLEQKWRPWRVRHQRWQRVQADYERLYRVHAALRREAETYELLVGWGLLRWRGTAGATAPVRRHLLVGRVALRFEARDGSLNVEVPAEGLRLALEDDMLFPGEQPPKEEREKCESLAQATLNGENAPAWPTSTELADALRTYVHSLDQRGAYRPDFAPSSVGPTAGETLAPTVVHAPALILRRRSSRGLVNLLDQLSQQLAAGNAEDVPDHVRQLCEDTAPAVPPFETDGEVGKAPLGEEEILFPLPANDAQREILERMAARSGVLVQGPPGTGKSHTIANLVCHSLAAGRRVLVTSQTPRALKVLHEKIKEASPEVAQLCVSLLGEDANALSGLDATVRHITERRQTWVPRENAAEATRLHTQLAQSRAEAAALAGDIRQRREAETWQHSVAGGAYRGSASDIAQRITRERTAHGWLEDAVAEPFREPPLTSAELARLLILWRRLPPGRVAELTGRCWPTSDEAPDPAAFRQALDEETAAREACGALAERLNQPRLRPLLAVETGVVSALAGALEDWRRGRAAAVVAVGNSPGLAAAWADVRAGRTRAWEELADVNSDTFNGFLARARVADERAVVLPPGERSWDELLADARDLHTHLAAGGGFGLPLFRPAVVRRAGYLAQEARVTGRPPRTAESLGGLVEHLETLLAVRRLRARWAGVLPAPAQPAASLARQVAEAEEADAALRGLLALRAPLDAARAAVARLPGLSEPDWNDPAGLGVLLDDAGAALMKRRWQTATARLEGWRATLNTAAGQPRAHPVAAALMAAVSARDFPAYAAAHDTLVAARADDEALARRGELHARLAEGGAPRLAAALATTATDPAWEGRLADLDAAWRWSSARTWLEAFLARGDASTLEEQLRKAQSATLTHTAELAANRAWGHLLTRLTEQQDRHLRAWAALMHGPRTGVRAERNRHAARRHLANCRDAVPAWIMPLHRVAESIEKPRPEMFDLLIIDEASQSGPEALALFYLARQVIVVGDDEQISPTEIGLRQADLDTLAARHLPDFPFSAALGLNSSVFGYADIRFAGRVLLREHFRCAPEIIRFSSDLCYEGKLLPLRRQPTDRLSPTLVSRHVAGGSREGAGATATNQAEAEALADAVAACCRDPAYAGKSFGVVSLLAEAQARLIARLLLKRLTPEEMERREIVCGDAYAFQGDERDVMFLSLVIAPNAAFAAQTGREARQRFNVAASRARDQAWLFHSVSLNELAPADVRARLLGHFLNPEAPSPTGEPDWELCDSEFERQVGRRIHARGYRLRPQFQPSGPNGYRLDFLVEGLRSQLAVECDGPHHDEPEQTGRDLHRQRQLERCGWEFWRVGAARFYADPERALTPLWTRLEELGIRPFPVGENVAPVTRTVSAVSSGVESRNVAQPFYQEELLPPTQPESLPPENPLPSPEAVAASAVGDVSEMAVRAYVAAARAKRPGGNLVPREIQQVTFDCVPADGRRIPRQTLVERVAAWASLPEAERQKVENALEKLDQQGRLTVNLQSVARPRAP